MRHRILLLIIAASLILLSRAEAKSIRHYGLKLGIVSANQSWDYHDNGLDWERYRRVGFIGGVFAEWSGSSHLSLVTEVEYVQKGFKEVMITTDGWSSQPTGKVSISPRIDYLSIPLLLKMRSGDSEISVYFLAGPRIDFVVGRVGKEYYSDVLDQFSSWEYGVTMGVGIEMKGLLMSSTGFELRYSPSLKKAYSSDLLSIRNSSLEFVLSVGL
jgi:hypothetical protein